ncbi:serine hydrolase domain-containing protein [Amycolatopsis anabasis]|uniref:serine hydrolase domain-containing protein n=1 Tax=Amycolatopsis anabasis TaxID=1840409 RepID=UPI00131CA905|nr:serine hydrolase domain-containing protein [Amycolatopsis anabasis]
MKLRGRRLLSIVTAVGAAVGVLVVPAAVSTAADGHGHAGVRRVLDRAVTEGGLPGILAEVRDGDRRWFGTAGVADTGTGRQRRAQDRFRIGSTTKTFAATLVLQLAGEHRLSLDDTVEKWLPGMVHGNGHDGGRITVRQLLNQTSGIFNYALDPEMLRHYLGPEFLEHRFDGASPEQLVRIATSHPPAFAPGTDWGYSNTNFILAGMIVERVTGATFAGELARRITGPLGLTGTYLPRGDDPSIRGPHSRHYSRLNMPDPSARVYDVTEMNSSWAWTAGGMISTAGELNRFFGALLGGRLLPPAQQREMFTTVPTHGWIDDAAYGLGMSSVRLPCGTTVWGMGGAINGSWSYTYGTRDGRHLVATNVNGDWADGDFQPRNPIGVFTDVLRAEFCTGGSR